MTTARLTPFSPAEIQAARVWLYDTKRTRAAARRALLAMGFTAGNYPAAQTIERADGLARDVLSTVPRATEAR